MQRCVRLLGGGLAALAALAWAGGAAGQTSPVGKAAPGTTATSDRALVEKLQHFDPHAVRLRWENRHWQLMHQGTVLKDFGLREHDARQALRLIHDLKLTEHGTVGSPRPVMEYWLSDGHAPQALALGGLRMLPLNPARLRVEQVNGQWCLGEGGRVLYTFGSSAADARQALAVMQKYHFNQAAVLGQGGPSMVVFLGRPDGESPAPTLAARSGSGRQINVPRFSRLAKNPDGSPRRERTGTAGPFAGVVAPALPSASPTSPAPPANAGPARPSLTGRQQPLWRAQPAPGSRATPAVAATAERVPFDWRQVQLRQGPGGEWKLAAGSLVLADFGPNAQQARLALSALRYYRFTEQWRISGAPPGQGYYVAGGAAPRGLMLGLSGQAFQPEKLEVRPVGQGYALCNGEQVVLSLGARQEEAARALETIRRTHVDQVSKVGEPGKETMTILVRSR